MNHSLNGPKFLKLTKITGYEMLVYFSSTISPFLINIDGSVVKITDFNVSKFIEKKSQKYSSLAKDNYKMWTYTGTIAFTAPEVFTQAEYT